jgi:MoaA/NifB/PqqE/SkfB family radical SAM enzyme
VESLPAEIAPSVPADPKAAKRANFDAYLANVAAGSLEATNRPVQLFLEVSSRCNLRCKKCGFSYDPSLAKNGRDLAWPVLARMDDFFAAAVEVYTFGYGEMFLYPELAPLVTVLKNHGCRTSGITNGVLIRPADVVWLVATGYDQLTFSIDGATESTMDKLRGASLAKILHTLELIRDEKARRKSEFPRIVVNFVAQNDNFHELPDLARRLAPLGIYFFGVNPLHHFAESGPYQPYYNEFRLSRVAREDVEAAVAEARNVLQASGTTFQNFVNPDFEWPTKPAGTDPVALHNRKLPEPPAPSEIPTQLATQASEAAAPVPSAPATVAPEPATPVPTNPETGLPRMYCHYPWTTLYLSAAGKARVCCFMSVHEDLGEFTGTADVGSAWNGAPLQSVREHIRDGRVHPACKQCVSHKTYEVHASAMNPIRAELGLPLPGFEPPSAPEPPEPELLPAVPEPPPEDEGSGVVRRFLRRWRAPDGDGAGRPA